jgi:hypothetical protein
VRPLFDGSEFTLLDLIPPESQLVSKTSNLAADQLEQLWMLLRLPEFGFVPA